MHTALMMVSVGAFVVLLFVLGGGPMLLVDWSRKRQEREIARQIALTDALDGALGAIVAPVVTKPLFGPWEIRLAVPPDQSDTLGRILSVVDEVFADVEGASSRSYRIFLSARPEPLRQAHAFRSPRSATRWAGNPIGAA